MILGFRREADQNCALLGCYEAYSGNFLPAFRYQSVAFSGIKNNLLVLEPWKKGAHDDNDDDVVVVVVAVAVRVVAVVVGLAAAATVVTVAAIEIATNKTILTVF